MFKCFRNIFFDVSDAPGVYLIPRAPERTQGWGEGGYSSFNRPSLYTTVHTVCPRSLVPFYIVTCDNTSWTYRIDSILIESSNALLN